MDISSIGWMVGLVCGVVLLIEIGRVGSSGNGGFFCVFEWRLEVEVVVVGFFEGVL